MWCLIFKNSKILEIIDRTLPEGGTADGDEVEIRKRKKRKPVAGLTATDFKDAVQPSQAEIELWNEQKELATQQILDCKTSQYEKHLLRLDKLEAGSPPRKAVLKKSKN